MITLEQRGDDSFLWIDFDIEEIRKVAGETAHIETMLDSLPTTLTEMYSFILVNIPSNLNLLAAKILSWSICARKPLEILELAVALNLDVRGRSDALRLVRSAVAACGNMLTINSGDAGEELGSEHHTDNIVHNSVVEFLSAETSAIHQNPRLDIGSRRGITDQEPLTHTQRGSASSRCGLLATTASSQAFDLPPVGAPSQFHLAARDSFSTAQSNQFTSSRDTVSSWFLPVRQQELYCVQSEPTCSHMKFAYLLGLKSQG